MTNPYETPVACKTPKKPAKPPRAAAEVLSSLLFTIAVVWLFAAPFIVVLSHELREIAWPCVLVASVGLAFLICIFCRRFELVGALVCILSTIVALFAMLTV